MLITIDELDAALKKMWGSMNSKLNQITLTSILDVTEKKMWGWVSGKHILVKLNIGCVNNHWRLDAALKKMWGSMNSKLNQITLTSILDVTEKKMWGWVFEKHIRCLLNIGGVNNHWGIRRGFEKNVRLNELKTQSNHADINIRRNREKNVRLSLGKIFPVIDS